MDSTLPTIDVPDRIDTADVLNLVAEIQDRVDQLKQVELQEHHREQELAAREAGLARRSEAFQDNLRSTWNQIEQQRDRLKQQRRHIARRFRELLKRRPAAISSHQPNRRELDDDRRALAQVKALLEDSEQEMLHRYVGPTALRLAMLATLTMLALAAASHWLAQQFVAPKAQATMVLAVPDGAMRQTPLASDPALDVLAEPPGHVTLLYRAAAPQDATAALERIAADLRERHASSPFAQRGNAVRIVQPPTIAQSAQQDRWRMTAILFAVGVGATLLMALFHRIRLARTPRIFDERMLHALAILEG
jgi:hypothetical protein